MKTLELNQMENIIASSDRGCAISGGLAAVSFIAGFFSGGAGFLAAAAITASAANAGCFD